jgi:hypothetical protein
VEVGAVVRVGHDAVADRAAAQERVRGQGRHGGSLAVGRSAGGGLDGGGPSEADRGVLRANLGLSLELVGGFDVLDDQVASPVVDCYAVCPHVHNLACASRLRKYQ